MHIKVTLLKAAVLCACIIISSMSFAEEISRFNTSRGMVRLSENAQRSSLNFDQEKGRIDLPIAWRETNIERVVPLKNQSTAAVISFADKTCAARQALIVFAANKIWGPYQLGDCEDNLAYQVSNDRNAFVAIRAGADSPKAWVYTADDSLFIGPANVTLPDSLARLTTSDITANSSTHNIPSHPTTKIPRTQSLRKQHKVVVAPKPASESVAPANLPAQRPRIEETSPAPVAKGELSNQDASVITREVKFSTKPQRRVSIDLS